MKEGCFYAYYKPSFLNGYHSFTEKDVNFTLLQAVEGVARDEFTFTPETLGEGWEKELKENEGQVTAEMQRKHFQNAFTRSYDVEFVFNPSMSEFKRKISVKGAAKKPVLLVYSKELYMSRFFSEFQNVLSKYEGMFDVYYTGDEKEASKYIYTGEFPEVLPIAVIYDPLERKMIGEKKQGAKKDEDWKHSYPMKYRSIIFMNKIEKDFKKMIEEFLDEKASH